MRITYYGHSCFLVEVGNKRLLFDPFITPNPLIKEGMVSLATLHPDYILLSHGHRDHIADALTIAQHSNAQIIAVYEVMEWMKAQGCTGHGLNTGGRRKFDFGTLRLVNAVHSSSLPDGSYGGSAVGFVISNDYSGTF